MGDLGRPNDRCGDTRRLQNPGTSNLSRRHTSLLGDLLYCGSHREILLVKIPLLSKLVGFCTLGNRCSALRVAVTSEEPPGQWTPRNDRYPLVNTEGDHFTLFFTIDEVVMI